MELRDIENLIPVQQRRGSQQTKSINRGLWQKSQDIGCKENYNNVQKAINLIDNHNQLKQKHLKRSSLCEKSNKTQQIQNAPLKPIENCESNSFIQAKRLKLYSKGKTKERSKTYSSEVLNDNKSQKKFSKRQKTQKQNKVKQERGRTKQTFENQQHERQEISNFQMLKRQVKELQSSEIVCRRYKQNSENIGANQNCFEFNNGQFSDQLEPFSNNNFQIQFPNFVVNNDFNSGPKVSVLAKNRQNIKKAPKNKAKYLRKHMGLGKKMSASNNCMNSKTSNQTTANKRQSRPRALKTSQSFLQGGFTITQNLQNCSTQNEHNFIGVRAATIAECIRAHQSKTSQYTDAGLKHFESQKQKGPVIPIKSGRNNPSGHQTPNSVHKYANTRPKTFKAQRANTQTYNDESFDNKRKMTYTPNGRNHQIKEDSLFHKNRQNFSRRTKTINISSFIKTPQNHHSKNKSFHSNIPSTQKYGIKGFHFPLSYAESQNSIFLPENNLRVQSIRQLGTAAQKENKAVLVIQDL